MSRMTTLVVAALLLATTAVCSATPIASYLIDPTSTFHRQESAAYGNTGYTSPLFIKLSDIGLTVGDDITITEFGNAFFAPDGDATYPSADTWSTNIAAAFTMTDGIAADAETTIDRLDTPISLIGTTHEGLATVLGGTFVSGSPRDIAEDFYVIRAGIIVVSAFYDGSLATVPYGAEYLVVGMLDSFAGDDFTDDLDPLGISISLGHLVTPVPTPAGLPIFVLGAIILLIRRRHILNRVEHRSRTH